MMPLEIEPHLPQANAIGIEQPLVSSLLSMTTLATSPQEVMVAGENSRAFTLILLVVHSLISQNFFLQILLLQQLLDLWGR